MTLLRYTLLLNSDSPKLVRSVLFQYFKYVQAQVLSVRERVVFITVKYLFCFIISVLPQTFADLDYAFARSPSILFCLHFLCLSFMPLTLYYKRFALPFCSLLLRLHSCDGFIFFFSSASFLSSAFPPIHCHLFLQLLHSYFVLFIHRDNSFSELCFVFPNTCQQCLIIFCISSVVTFFLLAF